MIKNEPMLVSASYFWSDALNAFLFGHGPMTPTLLDILMLTGLNIYALTDPMISSPRPIPDLTLGTLEVGKAI